MRKVVYEFLRSRFWKVVAIARHVSVLDISYIYFTCMIRRNMLIWCKPFGLKSYCICKNYTIHEIELKMERAVYVPEYFELSKGKEYRYMSPPIYAAIMHNVSAVGGTNLILSDGYVLADAYESDTEKRCIFKMGIVKRCGKKFILEVGKNILELDEAINLCGFASGNYYHFTVEILSRYNYLRQLKVNECIPVIIDESVKKYPQLLQLLQNVVNARKVIFVPEGMRVNVKKLIQLSMNTWMPMNVKNRNQFLLSDNAIAKSAIENIRFSGEKYMLPSQKRNIFISRKRTHIKRIVNEDMVAELFEKNGFEIVCTEDMNYAEQVALFSSAQCIVAATGAALTNVIYCNRGAILGCIIPKEYEFCIYSSIAHYVGMRTLFLNSDIITKHQYISADLCKVDMEQCERYIQELKKIINDKNIN